MIVLKVCLSAHDHRTFLHLSENYTRSNNTKSIYLDASRCIIRNEGCKWTTQPCTNFLWTLSVMKVTKAQFGLVSIWTISKNLILVSPKILILASSSQNSPNTVLRRQFWDCGRWKYDSLWNFSISDSILPNSKWHFGNYISFFANVDLFHYVPFPILAPVSLMWLMFHIP